MPPRGPVKPCFIIIIKLNQLELFWLQLCPYRTSASTCNCTGKTNTGEWFSLLFDPMIQLKTHGMIWRGEICLNISFSGNGKNQYSSWTDDGFIFTNTEWTLHYTDVIMGTMASQITSLTIVYSTVYSDTDQRKHQSSASLAFVWGVHRGPVNSPHKWPVTRKMFPFDDVIMWNLVLSSNFVN